VRSASLERSGKETGEVILIVPYPEMRTLIEMAEIAAKAAPRKSTYRKVLAQLDEVGCFT
jgi:hypothetical protein